jgi:methanogenic corrinoid protein MtbC1
LKTPLPDGIAFVARETGLSKEILRAWELRYGFPQPSRDEYGDRRYDPAEIEKLRLVKILVDQGFRPALLIRKSSAALHVLIESCVARSQNQNIFGDNDFNILKSCNFEAFDQWLAVCIEKNMLSFILDDVAPLLTRIGEAWMRDAIGVSDEHLIIEKIRRAITYKIDSTEDRAGARRVLLTTLPGEMHSLGLLMVEALLTARGWSCFALGCETPILDIVAACKSLEIDVLALSFGGNHAEKVIEADLSKLRAALDPSIAIWAGGAGIRKMRSVLPGVDYVTDLENCMTIAIQTRQREEKQQKPIDNADSSALH